MAITEDASTPAIATGTGTGNLVSASFSPPAGSRLEVMIAAQWGSGVAPVISIADSVGGTYLNPVSAVNAAGSARGAVKIFTRYLASAPGSMTVTASFDAGLAGGRHLVVRVLNGTNSDQTGAATATRDITPGATAWTASITTTQAGSQVYGMGDDPVANSTLTAAANTSLVGTAFQNATDATASAAFKATSVTGTPGATTLGLTCSVTEIGVLAMHEVLPAAAGGSTVLGDERPALISPELFPGGFAEFLAALPEQVYTQNPAWGPINGTTQSVTADFNGTSDVRLANNAEAGTPGATVATTDTGSGDPWDAVTIGSGASVVYSSTPDLAGNVGITYDVGVTSSSAFTQWTIGGTSSTATPFAGFRFSYAAQFGATCSIFSFNQGGTAVIRVQITATNKLRILDAAGATLYTSTTTLVPGNKYFVAVGFLAAVAGTYQLKLYDANGAVLETVTPTAGDFTGPVNLVRYGSVANQTNTNWKALTVDEFSYNSLTMPVPSDQSTMAGTTQVVTADFNGTAKTMGTLAGTTQGVTADLNGTAKVNGVLTGTTQIVTADLNGTAKDNGVLGGTTQVVAADFNGTATSGSTTGVLAGTTQVTTADFNGTATDRAVLAGTTQPVTADLNGTAKGNAVLAGSAGHPVADLNGTSKSSGPMAGIVGVTTADFNGTAKDNGVLGGVVGNVTADLNGTAKSSGPIAGATQKVTADINGSAAGGYLNGITQPVAADFNGSAKVTGAVAGSTQKVVADLNSLVLDRSILAGVIPGVTADFNGSVKDNAVFAGVVSHVSAHLTGTSPDVNDQSDLMPFFLAERGGYASHS